MELRGRQSPEWSGTPTDGEWSFEDFIEDAYEIEGVYRTREAAERREKEIWLSYHPSSESTIPDMRVTERTVKL